MFRPAEWSKGVVDKLRVEGATSVTLSPGLNPSVAVFIAEKNVSTRAQSHPSVQREDSCLVEYTHIGSRRSRGLGVIGLPLPHPELNVVACVPRGNIDSLTGRRDNRPASRSTASRHLPASRHARRLSLRRSVRRSSGTRLAPKS